MSTADRKPCRRSPCRLDSCNRNRQTADGLCQVHGENLTRRGDVYAYCPQALVRMAIDALWAKLTESEAYEPGECWLWPGKARTQKGYGHTKRHGESSSNRAAWVEAHGPIPDGLWVLHHCDNPPCVRPSHLYLGTPSDNVRDMYQRGRNAPAPRGEANALCRHSDDVVAEVRRRAAGGELRVDIGRDLGIHPSYVGRIARGLRR